MNPEDQKHRYCRQFVVTNHRGPTTGLSKSKPRILFDDMMVCNHSLGKLTNLCTLYDENQDIVCQICVPNIPTNVLMCL